MTLATGVGSLPGEDDREYAEAMRIVRGELPDLVHLPELPGRGAIASMTGRALATITDLGFDLQPAGWRLTDAAGLDHRRARSLLAQDLDQLEEQTQGYSGLLKVQVAGPWTLAATVEKPRGDRVLSDFGARRELAQALAEGVRAHLADVRRRVPGADLVLQIDEPVLPAVLDGRVPTASGFGRHRVVHPPEASETLGWVVAAAEGAEVWAHCCAAEAPLALLRGAGVRGLSVDLDVLAAAGHDVLAQALEAGERVALGVVPALEPATAPTTTSLVERVLRWLDVVGLDPAEVSAGLVITPTCGLAGASPDWARGAMTLARETAAALTA